jgi:hypothetical protein
MMSSLVTTTLTATLAFIVLTNSEAGAAAVQSYNYWTEGNIAGQAGVAPIYFNSASSPMFTSPGTFSLGQFDAAGILPTSATLTYNNTPFTVDLNVSTGAGTGPNAPYYTYEISGNLNGMITGTGSSTMVATVSSITGISEYVNGVWTTPPFPVSELQINAPQGITAPNGYQDGLTTLYAQVNPALGLPSPAPEPTSIAIVGVGLVAWGVRRRLARSRSTTL